MNPLNIDPHPPYWLHLANAACNGELTPPEHEQLQTLLRGDAQARLFFIAYMDLHATIAWERRADSDPAASMPGSASFELHTDQDTASLLREILDQERAAAAQRAELEADQTLQLMREKALENERWCRLTQGAATSQSVRRIVIPKAVFYGAIAAVVALTAMLFWPNQSPTPQVVEDQPTAPQLVQVATLVEQVDAKWLAPGSGEAPVPGDGLLNQRIHLTSGLAKIRFNNEAEVILEAPCSIEPISAGEIKITHGKLVGRCETVASKGFVVQTPGATIVDLGTEFGVKVDRNGVSDAHVLVGEIELTTTNITSPIKLRRDQARQVDAAGSRISTIKTNESAFVRREEFEANAKANQSPYHRWLAHSYKLRRDPSLRVYFTMEQQFEAERIRNHVAGSEDSRVSTHGAVSQPAFVVGRWPDKRALRIDRPEQAVRFNLSGEYSSMSLAAWVKLADVGEHIQVLVDADQWDRDGLVHWQVGADGRLAFSLFEQATPTNGEIIYANYKASAGLTAQHLHQWLHLATVYDAEKQRVRFYLNGRPIGAQAIARPAKLIFGPSRIGDWPDNDQIDHAVDATRVLDGVCGELAIFNQALSEQDIREMYETGRP